MTRCTKLNPAGITISHFFKMIYPNEDTGIFKSFAEACTKRQDWKNQDADTREITPEMIFEISQSLILVGRHFHLAQEPSLTGYLAFLFQLVYQQNLNHPQRNYIEWIQEGFIERFDEFFKSGTEALDKNFFRAWTYLKALLEISLLKGDELPQDEDTLKRLLGPSIGEEVSKMMFNK